MARRVAWALLWLTVAVGCAAAAALTSAWWLLLGTLGGLLGVYAALVGMSPARLADAVDGSDPGTGPAGYLG